MVVQQAGDLVEKLKEAGFEEKRGTSALIIFKKYNQK